MFSAADDNSWPENLSGDNMKSVSSTSYAISCTCFSELFNLDRLVQVTCHFILFGCLLCTQQHYWVSISNLPAERERKKYIFEIWTTLSQPKVPLPFVFSGIYAPTIQKRLIVFVPTMTYPMIPHHQNTALKTLYKSRREITD